MSTLQALAAAAMFPLIIGLTCAVTSAVFSFDSRNYRQAKVFAWVTIVSLVITVLAGAVLVYLLTSLPSEPAAASAAAFFLFPLVSKNSTILYDREEV